MAYLYESKPQIFNFYIPGMDKTVKMYNGERIKLIYKLVGAGYPLVLTLIDEIPVDDECLDNGPNGSSLMAALKLEMADEMAQLLANVSTTVNNIEIDIEDVYSNIITQAVGDPHFDNGYDFFGDAIFMEDMSAELSDYYSFFYLEVLLNDVGYLRTIETDDGPKHIRAAKGSDTYIYEGTEYPLVNYSKIVLPNPVKDIIEIRFDNKDVVKYGFELAEDMQTVFIYCDPDGFFINKSVAVRVIAQ